jgi:hypothetical protein
VGISSKLKECKFKRTGKVGNLPHFEEDVTEFFSHFHERVKSAGSRRDTHGVEIIRLENGGFPSSTEECQHYHKT